MPARRAANTALFLPQREGMARLDRRGAGPRGWVEQFVIGWVSRPPPCAHKKQDQQEQLLDGWWGT